jgi:hypothetical protein
MEPTAKPDRSLYACGLTLAAGVLAGLGRLVPNTYNFTPLGALGLFGGSRLRSWQAYALPLVLMVLTDLGLCIVTGDSKYSPLHLSRLYVYPSLLVYVVIGRYLVRRPSVKAIGGACLLGSMQFFLITNFCDWLLQPWMPGIPEVWRYSRDLAGLGTCYLNGLPFVRGGELFFFGLFLGDLFFTSLLFGAHALLTRQATAAVVVPAGLELQAAAK